MTKKIFSFLNDGETSRRKPKTSIDSEFNALSNCAKRKERNCQKHCRKRKERVIGSVFYQEKDQ